MSGTQERLLALLKTVAAGSWSGIRTGLVLDREQGAHYVRQYRQVRQEDGYHEGVVSEVDADVVEGLGGIRVIRPAETFHYGVLLVAGDKGVGKTTLLERCSNGGPHVQQVLRHHTATFCNVWMSPTDADVAMFEEEMTHARQLPLLPSQLCFATIHADTEDLRLFLQDDELRGSDSVIAPLAEEEWSPDARSVVLGKADGTAQHTIVQFLELGADFVDAYCSVLPGSPQPQLVQRPMVVDVAVSMLACCTGGFLYMVNGARLVQPGHIDGTVQRILALVRAVQPHDAVSVMLVVIAEGDVADVDAWVRQLCDGVTGGGGGKCVLQVEVLHGLLSVDASLQLVQRLCQRNLRLWRMGDRPVRCLIDAKLKALQEQLGKVDAVTARDVLTWLERHHNCHRHEEHPTSIPLQKLIHELLHLPPMVLVDTLLRREDRETAFV